MKIIKNIFEILVSLFLICGFFLFLFRFLFNPALEKIFELHLFSIFGYCFLILIIKLIGLVDYIDLKNDFEFKSADKFLSRSQISYILLLLQIILLLKYTFFLSSSKLENFLFKSTGQGFLQIYEMYFPTLFYVISCPLRRLIRIEKKLDGNSDE